MEEASGSHACEGFAGGEPGGFAAGGEHGPAAAGDLFDEQRFDDLDRVPALRFRCGDQLRGQRAGVGHLQLPHQLLHLDRQPGRGAHLSSGWLQVRRPVSGPSRWCLEPTTATR